HQSLPIYAGGLGVLAGDHCKEASDLGVPLIGVGFMYPQGYFHQHVSADGWQEESYERLNWVDAPIEEALTPDGKPCITAVPLGDRSVLVAVWRVRLGRVTLYLLDTSLRENAPWDRELSPRLYGGQRQARNPLGRLAQRGQPAARRGDACDVRADVAEHPGGRAAGDLRHQRRARPDVDCRRPQRPVLALSRRRLDRSPRRSGFVGRRARDP